MKHFRFYLRQRQKLVDKALQRCLPSATDKPVAIHKAMRYSVFCGGKRVRPILCLAACEAVSGHSARAMDSACAMELIHTYSLIHDDLPCMDDDDLRRGRPTSHKIFGEGMAVLAGDALLTHAFELLAKNGAGLPTTQALQVIKTIARAADSRNLIGGQVGDLQAEGKKVSLAALRHIHLQKTAALIEAAVEAGALAGKASPKQCSALRTYARNIGLAFQVADDILDVLGDEKKMGKRVRKDSAKQKATYPGILGLEKSRDYLKRLTRSALSSLRSFDAKADPLRAMARFIASRES